MRTQTERDWRKVSRHLSEKVKMTLTSEPAMSTESAFLKPMANVKAKPPSLFANPLRKRKRQRRLGAKTASTSGSGGEQDGEEAAHSSDPRGITEDDEEYDNVSVNSLEFTLQPDVKRSKRTMSRVSSLASVIGTPMARLGHSLSRSFSGARLPHQHGNKHASPSPSANSVTQVSRNL